MRKIVQGLDPELANELSEGGILWFTNLTDPDPWYSLPILSGILLYGNVEMSMGKKSLSGEVASQSNTAVLLKDGFQSLALFIPSFMANSPAGVQIYLATTFIFTLLQSMALRNDFFRNLVNLPSMDAPKPEAVLAKEFLNLAKKEQEAFKARGGSLGDNMENNSNEALKPILGKGVLAPGFTASFEGENRKSSIEGNSVIKTDMIAAPKTSIMIKNGEEESTNQNETNQFVTTNKNMEIMEAANKGLPLPRPIQIAPVVKKKIVKKDGKAIANSLKKKRRKDNKGSKKPNATGRK